MDTLKVGIVGIGWWSTEHAKAIHQSDLLELVTCYTRNEEKRKKFAEENHCEQDSSYEDLLARDDIDAVILTTPHSTHRELTEKAAKAGKHVFVEKPMALTVADCKAMIEAIEKAGLVISVGQDRRWNSTNRKIREFVTSGKVGRIIYAEASYFNHIGINITPDKWRWYKGESPGGPLSYLGVHMVDTLRFLFGEEVDEVHGIMDKMVIQAEIDDFAMATMRFHNGGYGTVTSIFTVPKTTYVNVYGTEMNIFSGDNTGLIIQYKGSDKVEHVDVDEKNPVQLELEDFAKSIRENRKPEVDGYEGMKNVAVLEAIIESSKKGAPVDPRSFL